MTRRKFDTRGFVGAAVMLFAALFVIGAGHCSCAPTYTAAQIRCVDKATTLAESKACRRAVDAEYGVTETTTKDAGHE